MNGKRHLTACDTGTRLASYNRALRLVFPLYQGGCEATGEGKLFEAEILNFREACLLCVG